MKSCLEASRRYQIRPDMNIPDGYDILSIVRRQQKPELRSCGGLDRLSLKKRRRLCQKNLGNGLDLLNSHMHSMEYST